MLKGVLTTGTGRRYPMDAWSAAGKTGTQDRNTNAWFVGGTPYLSTAVWLGDPDGYTPMVGIPELSEVNERAEVQGGLLPTRIWKTYMDPAHAGRRPPTGRHRPPRPVLRPVSTCRATSVSARWSAYIPGTVIPGTTAPGRPGPRARPPTGSPLRRRRLSRLRRRRPAGRRDDPGGPPSGATTTTPVTSPDIVIPPQPQYEVVEGGTTIPPYNLDPNAPLPSTPLANSTYPCR